MGFFVFFRRVDIRDVVEAIGWSINRKYSRRGRYSCTYNLVARIILRRVALPAQCRDLKILFRKHRRHMPGIFRGARDFSTTERSIYTKQHERNIYAKKLTSICQSCWVQEIFSGSSYRFNRRNSHWKKLSLVTFLLNFFIQWTQTQESTEVSRGNSSWRTRSTRCRAHTRKATWLNSLCTQWAGRNSRRFAWFWMEAVLHLHVRRVQWAWVHKCYIAKLSLIYRKHMHRTEPFLVPERL